MAAVATVAATGGAAVPVLTAVSTPVLNVTASAVAAASIKVAVGSAVAATVSVGAVGAEQVYEFAHSKRPTGRPELKQQGREHLERKKGKNWKKISGKKPRSQPRPHHPSKKGHRKYFVKAVLW